MSLQDKLNMMLGREKTKPNDFQITSTLPEADEKLAKDLVGEWKKEVAKTVIDRIEDVVLKNFDYIVDDTKITIYLNPDKTAKIHELDPDESVRFDPDAEVVINPVQRDGKNFIMVKAKYNLVKDKFESSTVLISTEDINRKDLVDNIVDKTRSMLKAIKVL